MIKTFKHKGLKKFFETGSKAGIQAKHDRKLRMQLAAIDTATIIE
ncbi:type II toxin-antitoxin system RelE/ParE family toxin [Aliivibrio salmonicida]